MADQGWYIDSGVTHHITNNLQNMHIGNEYSGNQLLLVGNGQGLLFHILVMHIFKHHAIYFYT